jgi:hypothetical protein
MSRRRVQETALLILIAALAAVGVETLGSATPLRIVAGITLLLALPWLAASRLPPIRRTEITGGRLSASGALAFAALILLGLLLSTTAAGITTNGIVTGALIVAGGLAVLGVPGERGSPSPIPWPSLFGLTMIGIAVAISVLAFTLARNRALTQARAETSYSAFLIEDGKRLSVGLYNRTDRAAMFTVRDLDRSAASATTVNVPPHGSRTVPGVIAQPPPLPPNQRFSSQRVRPVNIRVSISVDGRPRRPALMLSAYGH